MKHFCSILMIIFIVNSGYALERKELINVSIDEFMSDLQPNVIAPNDHLAVIWLVPIEHWEISFESDQSMSESEKQEFLNTLDPYFLIAICQADISTFGAFKFYTKKQVEKNLNVVLYKDSDDSLSLFPTDDVSEDVSVLLAMLRPMFAQAAGNLGENFHFFVFKNYDRNSNPILDPYLISNLNISIKTKKDEFLDSIIEFPLNSLYVPRMCPNGKPAHVSWKYCPWTGSELNE